MKKKALYIHGDVVIAEQTLPKGLTKWTKNSVVQEGEAHNHIHSFEGDFTLYKTDPELDYPDFIEVGSGGATIKHIDTGTGGKAEHDDLKVDEGCYNLRQQIYRNAQNEDVEVVD